MIKNKGSNIDWNKGYYEGYAAGYQKSHPFKTLQWKAGLVLRKLLHLKKPLGFQ